MWQTQLAVFARCTVTTFCIHHAVAIGPSERLHSQSFGHARQYPTAPWGKITPPTRAKFVQPLLSHTLLSPGEIRERASRITLLHLARNRILCRGFEQWNPL